VLAGLIVVALGYLGWHRQNPAPRTVALSDPAQRLGAEEAFATGLRLGSAGHHLGSLPYFRRAVALAPDSWTARENFANTLYNGAQEARFHLGKNEPGTRSSVERMTMIVESLHQTDTAAALTSEAADRAVVLFQRGQAFHTFGLAIDGLLQFRQAAVLQPANPQVTRALAGATTKLRTGGLTE
jgi:hypothetical protein